MKTKMVADGAVITESSPSAALSLDEPSKGAEPMAHTVHKENGLDSIKMTAAVEKISEVRDESLNDSRVNGQVAAPTCGGGKAGEAEEGSGESGVGGLGVGVGVRNGLAANGGGATQEKSQNDVENSQNDAERSQNDVENSHNDVDTSATSSDGGAAAAAAATAPKHVEVDESTTKTSPEVTDGAMTGEQQCHEDRQASEPASRTDDSRESSVDGDLTTTAAATAMATATAGTATAVSGVTATTVNGSVVPSFDDANSRRCEPSGDANTSNTDDPLAEFTSQPVGGSSGGGPSGGDDPAPPSDCLLVSYNARKRPGDELSALLTKPIKREKIDSGYGDVPPASSPAVRPVVITPSAPAPLRFMARPLGGAGGRPRSGALTRVLLGTRPCRLQLVNRATKGAPPRGVSVPHRGVGATNSPPIAIRSSAVEYITGRMLAPRVITPAGAARRVVTTAPRVVTAVGTAPRVIPPVGAGSMVVNTVVTAPRVIPLVGAGPRVVTAPRVMTSVVTAPRVIPPVGAGPRVVTAPKVVGRVGRPTGSTRPAKVTVVNGSPPKTSSLADVLLRPRDVKTYRAPSPPPPIFTDGDDVPRWACGECGDAFALATSLGGHMTRRSVDICWTPPGGAAVRFYNRCALQAALRVAGVVAGAAEVKVTALEGGAGGFYGCGECGHEVGSAEGLQRHLDGGEVGACDSCGLCLSGCRAKAHARTHALCLPYVCPECGASAHASRDAFARHLRRLCHHAERCVRYACAACERVFEALAEARAHIVSQHAPAYHKCGACPMAFRSAGAFRTHTERVPACATATATLLLKCPLCDTVFKESSQLSTHLADSHVTKHMGCAHFACRACGEVSASRATHVAHVVARHPQQHDADDDAQRPLVATVKQVPAPAGGMSRRCDRCKMDFADRAAFARHMRKHRFLAGRRHLARPPPPPPAVAPPVVQLSCRVCGVVLSGEAALAAHERTAHGTQRSHACHLCADAFASAAQLACHHEAVHCAAVAVHTPATHGFLCPVCGAEGVRRTFKRRTQLDKHLAGSHHYDSPAVLPATATEVVPAPPVKKESPAPLKTLRRAVDADFVCAKCEFRAGDRAAFARHIGAHRSRECGAQCPDCGLCFAVTPALKRHLRVVHRVTDMAGYERETGVVLASPPASPPPAPLSPLPTPTNPLQCGVCQRVFDDALAVRTHMRTHGMAFIRSNCIASAAPR